MWAGKTIVWTNSNYSTRVTARETNLGCCAWIPHIAVNTAKENTHAGGSDKDVAYSWRQLATSSEMSQFPQGLPEGLQSQNPHTTEVHSCLGWRSSTVRFPRCFIFHSIPLLLWSCTPASLKFILWAEGLTSPSGHTLLDNSPFTVSYCFPILLKRLGLLCFSLGGGRCLVFCCGGCSCYLRYYVVQAAWEVPTLCLGLPSQGLQTCGTVLNFHFPLKRSREKKKAY